MAIRWGVVAATSGLLVFGAAAPALASDIGAVATASGAAASSTGARVIVSWDGKTETMDVALGLRSSGPVGLVLPTPAKATVQPGSSSLFDLADRAIAPVEHIEDDWWGRTAPTADEPDAPASVPVGEVSPATIRASDRHGLTRWLKKNKLHLTDAARDQIADYASDGWSLSTIALDPARAIDGELAPIRLSFRTDELLLPMRLAAAGTTATTLRVYVLADHRAEFRLSGSTTKNINAAQATVWSGPVTAPDLASRGGYLTVTDLRFDDPDSQVVNDVAVVDAPSDATEIPSIVRLRQVTLLGLPLGWLLVGWGGAGVLVGIGYLVNRFRAR